MGKREGELCLISKKGEKEKGGYAVQERFMNNIRGKGKGGEQRKKGNPLRRGHDRFPKEASEREWLFEKRGERDKGEKHRKGERGCATMWAAGYLRKPDTNSRKNVGRAGPRKKGKRE